MDKSRLDRLLSDFHIISGMEISVISAEFHSIAIKRCKGRNLCSFFHRAEGAMEICKCSDVERLAEASRSSSPIRYTCPIGITEAIIPINVGEEIVAYLFVSMGINSDEISDGQILSKILELAPRGDAEEFAELISRMRHLDEREIEAYISILKMIAEHIANDKAILYDKESIGRQIKYYVKRNLTRKLSLADIAWNLHCSTVTLTEHFKAEFGITVNEYITKKRMELSENLLITTSHPLREIAELSGFSDVEYFSRTFKRYHGVSPAAWRKSNK